MAAKPKPYNGGQWTEARMHSFIKGALRQASLRWPPKATAKAKARVARGLYRCAGYGVDPHEVTATLPPVRPGGRRVDNALVDHIQPVVSPVYGFQGWDILIGRLFCEADGLQVLCHDCHQKKTQEERELAKCQTK